MTILRLPDGSLRQFDFGPAGGRDIHVNTGLSSSFVDDAIKQPRRTRGKKRVQGEIREAQVRSSSSQALSGTQAFARHQLGREWVCQQDAGHCFCTRSA